MSAAGGGGAGAVVRQGHLRKLKTMKKKYFVLRAETPECSARLEYYESEKKFRAGASPRRVLPLKSCYNIMRRLDLKQKHVIALFTREEQFCIVAENEQELHAWLTAILKQHRTDDASDELLHPIQHVWQVYVQKKGLGATKNIQGLYNLCLTDKTLTLVKIKSHNNVISDLGILERVEYSLKNIRRCGDSERFFYMEVGRQTTTGAGELWMHTDDSNIAQSMHSTIYHAMRNCAKETENERDHIVLPKQADALPARRQTYSDGRGRAGLSEGLCVGACIRQCVCASNSASLDEPAAPPPPASLPDAGTLRNRCDSMPSRACSSFEVERPPQRYTELEGLDVSRDEADSMVEWYRTPRIPEEPDSCDISRDFMSAVLGSGSLAHSRTSSLGEAGYLPMAPGHEPLAGLVSASSGSLCSGTPSTDPRFSEYQLEPATSHIAAESRPPRAYSVGSRPGTAPAPEPRHRAYSVGARARPPRHPPHHAHRAPTTDHMEIDFSANSPANRVIARTPPTACFVEPRPKTNVDEYVDMSPRNAGYVEMRPGSPLARSPPLAAMTPLASLGGLAPLGHLAPMSAPVPGPAATPEGYVEMNYGRAATRPIAIGAARPPPPLAASPDERRRTPHGSQTLFDMSLDSPASPQDADAADALDDEAPHQPLSTVSEASEEPAAPRAPPAVSVSPQYVTLARPEPCAEELSCNPTATKTMARVADPVDTRGQYSVGPCTCGARVPATRTDVWCCAAEGAAARVLAGGGAGAARFSVEGGVHYAALDLEPRRAAAAPAMRAYTQIDFLRSEKLHAADAT
ncbi:insulin receptor substrate 1 isoform X6 [Trichoplusia ni]|uniref:Insulin receptor substrate 1 n=1 Tax=Trichoplusia ni TaxID=7111 RepID=A0A7E5VXR1_TRINI|nr:insulin receptor substrate 1 isoform X6 [Trichoplusia ni]